MGDTTCRSSGAGVHRAAWFYKYVAATRLGAFAPGFWGKATLTTACLVVGIVSAQTPIYKTYTNARFGYSISYPSKLLKAQGEAENGDGQTFRASDGRAEMRVWGGYNVNNESLRVVYDKTISEWGSGVSYKTMNQDWFVVSALVKGKIHYRKTMLRKDVLKTLEIEYDESQKATYDSITARVSKSFVG